MSTKIPIYPGQGIQVKFRWNNRTFYTMNPQFRLQIKGAGFDWIATAWTRLGPVASNSVSPDRYLNIAVPTEWFKPGAEIEVEVKFKDDTFGIGETTLVNYMKQFDTVVYFPSLSSDMITWNSGVINIIPV